MFEIDLRSRQPIYEQVVENYKRLIILGLLKADDKVPSVRDMAKQLTCNPNTVQKAYRTLESQGFFYTIPGQGSFISTLDTKDITDKLPELYDRLDGLIQEFEFFGMTRNDIIAYIGKEHEDGKD